MHMDLTSMLVSRRSGTSLASAPGPANLSGVWINGPYPAGKYNDIAIFNDVLAHCLDPYERMEADCGYRGHADKIKCPENVGNPAENLAMQGRVRARHETFNGRLKNFEILKQVFRHDISYHGPVLRACCVLDQLMLENGEPLFSVEYSGTAMIDDE